MTPHHARLAVGVFVLLSAGVAANILWFQGNHNGKNARMQIERMAQRTGADRVKRLTLDPPPDVRGSTAVSINSSMPLADAADKSGIRTSLEPGNRAGELTKADGLAATEVTASIQRELQTRGYQPGTPDGVAGAVTRAAIMAWEHDHGLALTGEPTEIVMKTIVLGVSPASAAQITAQWQALPKDRRIRAEQLIKWTQQSLSALGYNLGRVTGRINEDTERAIREFEMDQKLHPSGRISAPLVARITKLTLPTRNGPNR